MARAALHEEEDHVFGARAEVRNLGRHGIERAAVAEQGAAREGGERHGAEAATGPL